MAETKLDGVEKREKTTVFGLGAVRRLPGRVLVVVTREGMLKIDKPGGSHYGDSAWQNTYQGVSGAGYVTPRTGFGPTYSVNPTGRGIGFACSVDVKVLFHYDYTDLSNTKASVPVTVSFGAGERVKPVYVSRHISAQLTNAKLGSGGSGGVECGMDCELERGCSEDANLREEVDAIVAKNVPVPTPSGFTPSFPGLMTGGLGNHVSIGPARVSREHNRRYETPWNVEPV